MRVHWIASVFSILVSMGVLLVVMGQYHTIDMLNKTADRLKVESERLSKQYPHEDQQYNLVGREFSDNLKEVDTMEREVVRLTKGMESKKDEVQKCQAETKTDADGVDEAEKVQLETEATLRAESDAWNREIESLKAKLVEPSPVCVYVKHDAMIGNLCGTQA